MSLPAPATLRPVALAPPGQGAVRWARLARWSVQGGSAVLDQALFALANLTLNLLLARWLPPAEYGAFVAAQTLFLLLGVVHAALIVEPMLVLGAGRYRECFRSYFRHLLRYHWMVAGAGGALLAGAGLVAWLLGARAVAQALVATAAAAPFVLFGWLARRACYAEGRPHRAAAGGLGYAVLMVAGLLILQQTGRLSVSAALAVMAAASLAAGVFIMSRGAGETTSRARLVEAARVWPAHWRFGRWGSGGNVLAWFQGHVYYLVLPLWAGLEGTAALRALANFVLPILHADSALTTLLVPVFVRARAHSARFYRLVTVCAALFTVEGLLFWAGMTLAGGELVAQTYGRKYAGDAHLLGWYALLPVVLSVTGVLGGALRALERPAPVFAATAAAAGVALTLGLWAVHAWGVGGAIAGMLVAAAVQPLILASVLWKGRS